MHLPTFLTSLERSKWPVEAAGNTKALEMAARSAWLQQGARYGSAWLLENTAPASVFDFERAQLLWSA